MREGLREALHLRKQMGIDTSSMNRNCYHRIELWRSSTDAESQDKTENTIKRTPKRSPRNGGGRNTKELVIDLTLFEVITENVNAEIANR